jgi:hypothetical protein
MPAGYEERTERRIAAAILIGASAVMLAPLILHWTGREIALLRDLGFSPEGLAPARAWIAALALAAAYIAYTFHAVPLVYRLRYELSALKAIGVVAAFASGIMEEVVFRRWLMDTLMAQGVGDLGQILASGLVFGLAHLVWHLFSFDWRFSLYAAAATIVAGMALAALYLLGGRNLGPCIAAHMLINLVIEPWLVLAAVSRSAEPRDR